MVGSPKSFGARSNLFGGRRIGVAEAGTGRGNEAAAAGSGEGGDALTDDDQTAGGGRGRRFRRDRRWRDETAGSAGGGDLLGGRASNQFEESLAVGVAGGLGFQARG